MSTTIHFTPLGQEAQSPREYPLSDIDARLSRSNFFDGRLLTAQDLTREQVYIDERLKELGRSYGQGIINGLEVQLSDGEISIAPGQALAPSGRVLLLESSLKINLNDAAQIRLLNNNDYIYINYGLYALILQYAEQKQDLAEVFPTQLAQATEPRANTIVEGVKVTLVKLEENLNQRDQYAVRERLIAAEGLHQTLGSKLPEDGVALGVIAFDNNSPIWLDSEILRQPLRAESNEQSINEDFFRRHYQLYQDILNDQQYINRAGKIYAAEFFSLMPPVGPVPKNTINAEAATQSYFPENFSVSIVPVNYNELNTILTESLSLSPLNLKAADRQDIMILAPLEETQYLKIAQLMEGDDIFQERGLPFLKPLPLLAYKQANSLSSQTRLHWQTIWNQLSEGDLYYIKRPQRAAETGVSAIVLARGAIQAVPDSSTDNSGNTPSVSTETSINSGVNILQPVLTANSIRSNILTPSVVKPRRLSLVDENETLLRHINLQLMAKTRPPRNNFEQKALDKLIALKADDAGFVIPLITVLMIIERHYDNSLWRTALQLALKGDIRVFSQYLVKSATDTSNTAELILKAGTEQGLPLTNSLKKQWQKLSQEA